MIPDEQNDILLILLAAFLQHHQAAFRAPAFVPKDTMDRLGRFATVPPKSTITYREFLALHQRSTAHVREV